uniref:CID domain-containing protein n=1 Tax=Bionectria ochroleuca TaxID=29856 RepID=A0A8H7TV82_BIOOC
MLKPSFYCSTRPLSNARPNVQKCRSWIVDNIAVSSTHRATALGKYLAALASKPSDRGRRISLKRWRLHILYLLNDVIHHLVTRLNNHKLESAWEAHLPALFAAAADFDQCPKHKKKLENLLDLWQEKSYFSASFIAKLRDALANGVSPQQPLSQSISNTSVKLSKDTPFILPALHGDPSTPWFDLPASTWLMHMEANSTKPMKPEEIKPLQLKAGPASQKLVAAVQDLLADADYLFSKESQENNDEINELGERIILDDVTGEIAILRADEGPQTESEEWEGKGPLKVQIKVHVNVGPGFATSLLEPRSCIVPESSIFRLAATWTRSLQQSKPELRFTTLSSTLV